MLFKAAKTAEVVVAAMMIAEAEATVITMEIAIVAQTMITAEVAVAMMTIDAEADVEDMVADERDIREDKESTEMAMVFSTTGMTIIVHMV